MPFEVPARIRLAEPDAARLARIRESFTKSAAPVRTLPSNAAMMSACVGVLIVLALIFTIPVGFKGFAGLSIAGAASEYSVLLLLAIVLAGSVVQQMIPGSRRSIQPGVAVLLAILLLGVTACLLFPDFELHNFVQRGWPCLALGTLCAIPGAALVAVLMRKGFAANPISAAIAGGALSGLLGVAVLALHCPIFSASHVIVWHGAVLAVTSLAGAGGGWMLSRYRK